jgi:hypothetical protein
MQKWSQKQPHVDTKRVITARAHINDDLLASTECYSIYYRTGLRCCAFIPSLFPCAPQLPVMHGPITYGVGASSFPSSVVWLKYPQFSSQCKLSTMRPLGRTAVHFVTQLSLVNSCSSCRFWGRTRNCCTLCLPQHLLPPHT